MLSCLNDRVAAENFQQHAEHYLRMLSEAAAQKEQDARREAAGAPEPRTPGRSATVNVPNVRNAKQTPD